MPSLSCKLQGQTALTESHTNIVNDNNSVTLKISCFQVFHMNSVSGGHPNPPPPLMDGHDVQDGPIYHGQFF